MSANVADANVVDNIQKAYQMMSPCPVPLQIIYRGGEKNPWMVQMGSFYGEGETQEKACTHLLASICIAISDRANDLSQQAKGLFAAIEDFKASANLDEVWNEIALRNHDDYEVDDDW